MVCTLQVWYADDAHAHSRWQKIKDLFQTLQIIGPAYGYFPEPTKSILIVAPHRVEAANEFFAEFKFEVTTGCRYLGGFLGEKSKQDEWIVKKKINFWIGAVDKFAMVARKHPQSAYAIYKMPSDGMAISATSCQRHQPLLRTTGKSYHRETCSSNPRSQESRDTLHSRADVTPSEMGRLRHDKSHETLERKLSVKQTDHRTPFKSYPRNRRTRSREIQQ